MELVHILPYLLVRIFLVFQNQKTNLSLISFYLGHQVCCIKSKGFCPNFYYSFSIPTLYKIALIITVKYKFVGFPRPFLALATFSLVATLVVVCIPELRIANILRMLIRSPMLATKGTPADHDTQTCCLGPTLN